MELSGEIAIASMLATGSLFMVVFVTIQVKKWAKSLSN